MSNEHHTNNIKTAMPTQSRSATSMYLASIASSSSNMKKNQATKQQQKESVVIRGLHFANEFFASLFFAFKYVTADTKKRFVSFIVGLITIIIVVFVVSILYNSILKASIVFVKFSEEQVGETDMMFTPRFTNSSVIPFLNETEISERLSGTKQVVGLSSRWILFGQVENRDRPDRNTSAVFLIVDTKKEKKIGLGRQWPHRPLGEAECHAKDGILRAVDIEPNTGGRVNLKIELSTLLQAFSGTNQAISQAVSESAATGEDTSNNQEVDDNTSSALQINPLELLRTVLESGGVDFNREITVNLTDAVVRLEDGGVQIPPIIDIALRGLGEVNVTGEQLWNIIVNNSTNSSLLLSLGSLSLEYSVIDSVGSAAGKYPPALGNVVILDSKYVLRALADSILDTGFINVFLQLFGSPTAFRQTLSQVNINQYSLSVVGMYRDRFKTYSKKKIDMNNDIIDLTDKLFNALGVSYPATLAFPIAQVLDGVEFLGLFLEQIFVGVVVLLGILGVILIFALLLANVEEKTYEYGMLRALGLKKYSLVQVIISQALLFAIPGVIFGMIGSFLSNIAVEFIIRDRVVYASYKINYVLNYIAIIIPIVLGISIPLVANITPIRTALSRTLRDSLDVTHQTFNETKVKMVKLEDLGVEPWQTAVSIALVIIGFVVYYLIPLAFIFQNLTVFFYILNAILLAMLFGLVMVASVLQPVLERIILFVMLIGPERRLHTLISKNLAGHRSRSRKTFLMFTLAIAFVIFAGVGFSLQVTNIVTNVRAFVGADAVMASLTALYSLPEDKITPYLEEQKANGLIVDYSYQTFSLTDLKYVRTSYFSNLANYPEVGVGVFGLSRNYLQVAYSEYLLYSSNDKSFKYKKTNGKPDFIDSLYKDAGKALVNGEKEGYYPLRTFSGVKVGQDPNATESFSTIEKYESYVDVIVSKAMGPAASVAIKIPLQLVLSTSNPKTGVRSSNDYLAKSRALVYKVPGFFYSSYQFSAEQSPLLVSLDTYQKMAERCAASVNYEFDGSVPKQKVFIKFKTKNTKKRQDLMNGLKSLTTAEFVLIQVVPELIQTTKATTNALLGFFNIVAAIAIVLCFFILTLSFTANVRDNSWEFGVLRSIGLNVNQLIRAYIYEALCLVIAALLSGTIIGILIALTLTAQFNIFLEMPLQFAFPYWLFISIIVMSLFVAVVGSFIPARVLRNKEIALVLRGLE